MKILMIVEKKNYYNNLRRWVVLDNYYDNLNEDGWLWIIIRKILMKMNDSR